MHCLRSLRHLHPRCMPAQSRSEICAPAAMQIHTCASQARQLEHVIPRPQRRRKRIAHPRLSAAVAGVALRHPVNPSTRTRSRLDPPSLRRNVLVACKQPLNRDSRIVRRTLSIVVPGQCNHAFRQPRRHPFVESHNPVRGSRNIRPAKSRLWNPRAHCFCITRSTPCR